MLSKCEEYYLFSKDLDLEVTAPTEQIQELLSNFHSNLLQIEIEDNIINFLQYSDQLHKISNCCKKEALKCYCKNFKSKSGLIQIGTGLK